MMAPQVPTPGATYTFNWPPKELSPNARVHWWVLARARRGYKEECGWIILSVKGVRLKPPVTAQVTFVVTDSRRRDSDNYMAMLKVCFDALVEMEVLIDDNKDVLTILDPKWERGKTKQVVVELEEAS